MCELKGRHPEIALETLCRLFGFTRQGLWKQGQAHYAEEIDDTAIVNEVRIIRRDMPRLGVRKLQVILAGGGHEVSRDKLFDILRDSGLLVRRSHRRIATTNSRHWMKKWKNLIKGVTPEHPDQVWVSDITYIEVVHGDQRTFMYLSLITDAYTHEIVGYAQHDTLDTDGPLKALSMAVASRPAKSLCGLIHHSDRGSQYCCQEYVRKLQTAGILISMTENGDPYENAVAERVNGILKTEWLYHMKLSSQQEARETIDRIIYLYNHVRPHQSVGNMTPSAARITPCPVRKLWRNYWRLKRQGQQQAGVERPPGELATDGLLVADALRGRAAAVLI